MIRRHQRERWSIGILAPSLPPPPARFRRLTLGSCGSFSCGPGACVAIGSGCACAPPECPTLTFTPMIPTATSTPTPTAPLFTCAGDCNGDGKVTVDELLKLVKINIELIIEPPLECPHGLPVSSATNPSLR